MLEVNGITTKYGPVTALLDVSMSVAPGEIVAIVGEMALARRPCSGRSAAFCGQQKAQFRSTAKI